MQRSVVLATIAVLLVAVGSLSAAVTVPRYDCPEGLILIAEPERWPTNNDFTCVPVTQSDQGTPWAHHVSDRLWIKIAIAVAGVILGGALTSPRLTRRHRRQQAIVRMDSA